MEGNVVNSGPSVDSSKPTSCGAADSEHGEEEIVLQSSAMTTQSETNQEKHNGLTSAIDANGSTVAESSHTAKSRSPIIDIDNGDAICMRTRARYSLASFTLDELETFLQGTDDDEELQNVDDEEEYRKFLSAVLRGGDADGSSSHENENPDDEDEDNDADFEIELEELLESDVDDNAAVNARKGYEGAGRRPETRQTKRQKVSAQCEKKTLGQVKRPLRPILPNCHNGPLPSGRGLIPEATLQSSASGNLVYGFTPQQIGQLHCLIYEHVQLLIQVFSLSVLEPSQKQVASQVQGFLFEMLHRRDEALALKRTPYPSICFTRSYACSSVSSGISRHVQGHGSMESASTPEGQRVCFPQSNQSISEGSVWVPFVKGPLQSILDVSPLSLVGKYVEDIYSAAQEFRKRYIESGCDSLVEKEPLFPFAEANNEISNGTTTEAVNTFSASPGQQPKKTLAALLLESTKKQSIALVPKEVAKLTQRFLPLFNPALFPHKPPPAAVVHRVLFTDSEDELLALGMMEYNTDWKAIQQRFLPCKSKHQIFVRQKNRCSSKAPENPIKAVRRMKTSPLTMEEIACIQEGIKYYKFDWMSVWQYIVPYRDPSLLPRQWRIALGTQKSYKVDASKREQRRLYESRRRKLKAAASESWQATSDKEDCEAEISDSENCMDYVHQAFLADWRPDSSTHTGVHNCGGCGKTQDQNIYRSGFPSVPNLHQFIHTASDSRNGVTGAPIAINPKIQGFDVITSSKYYCRPYRSQRVNNTHLVKLAPDLPPVNLPPSVRIVSQTAFKGFQCGTSKIYPPGCVANAFRKDNSASQIPHVEKFGTVHQGARPVLKESVAGSQLDKSGVVEDACTDLQMHPLLFQGTEDVNVPYQPLKFSSGTSNSLNLFSGTQPQLNLSLFHNSLQQSHIDCCNKSVKSKDSTLGSGGIDFHPLLQKSNDTKSPNNVDTVPAESYVTSDVPAIANRSSGLNDKSNEIDLEIHLSSASGREKSVKNRQPKASDPIGSKETAAVCGTAMELQENSVPYSQHSGKNPSASSSELASSALPSAGPNDNVTRYAIDDIGDQSHPGIVMEQEELSDSEEDIEENVEFECEEMDDSEGEDGSGCDQAPQVQNMEALNSEGNVAQYIACLKRPCDPTPPSDTQADNSLLNDTSTLNMALNSEGNDGKSNFSWLSLDSCSADIEVGKKMGESPASKSSTIGEAVTKERDTVNKAQQPATNPLVITTPRKPRKRSAKSNSNLNIGLSVERSGFDGNHVNG